MVHAALGGVDPGMDLAWDLFFGSSLIVAFPPVLRHSRLGPWWAVPALVLGILLVGLNAAMVPWPPATVGLFDGGPVIGHMVCALRFRLSLLPRARSGWGAGGQVHTRPG